MRREIDGLVHGWCLGLLWMRQTLNLAVEVLSIGYFTVRFEKIGQACRCWVMLFFGPGFDSQRLHQKYHHMNEFWCAEFLNLNFGPFFIKFVAISIRDKKLKADLVS